MGIKDKLYEITKNMPKDKALDFLDRYKDSIKHKDILDKREKAKSIGEIIKDLEILK